jgi:hypothetical protein
MYAAQLSKKQPAKGKATPIIPATENRTWIRELTFAGFIGSPPKSALPAGLLAKVSALIIP